MSATDDLGAPLRALEKLCAERHHGGTERELDADEAAAPVTSPGSILGNLSAEDEALVGAIRQSLARLGAAIEWEGRSKAQASALRAVLDGTELVMRAELIRGQAKQLPGLLPGFVSLVALALADQDEAIELSQRAAQLIRASAAGRNSGLGEEP